MVKAQDHNDSRSQKGSGASKKRGTVNNARRLQAFADRKGGGSADWGSCDPKWLQAAVLAITGLGGAITFGLSRDEGAHSLTLLLDGDRQTLWFNGDADLDEELEGVCAMLEAMA